MFFLNEGPCEPLSSPLVDLCNKILSEPPNFKDESFNMFYSVSGFPDNMSTTGAIGGIWWFCYAFG